MSIVNIPTEFLFEVRAQVAAPVVIGPSSHGVRRIIPITGGDFDGPRGRGRVLAGGADWQWLRTDGVHELEARYTIQMEDGALVSVVNRAIRHAPPGVLDRIMAGEQLPPDAYYFRTSPVFEAPVGPHEWLNKGIFVGIAQRTAQAAIVRVHLVL